MLKTVRHGLFPPWVRFLNKSFRSYRKLNSIVRERHLPLLDSNPLRAKKKSDTLFVMGGGASVLTYTPDEWKTIADHDSIGLSYWMLHPFVPTYYIFELTKYEWDLPCTVKNLGERTDLTSAASLYLKDAERFDKETINSALDTLPKNMQNPVNLVWDAEIPGDTVTEFTHAVRSLNRISFFEGGRYWAVPKKRATIFMAISLAVRAGYKNIVLCGVDLNNTRYFFKSPEFEVKSNLCVPPDYQSGPVHKTNDPKEGELTISAILDVFDRIVLQPRGITLSVAKSSSALFPRFSTYFG